VKIAREQVLGFRLARHALDSRAPAGSLVSVARALCGVHAQLASSAELSLWARIEGLTRRDVERALADERTLVKTWAMRGTLHLLPADDLALYVAVLRAPWDHPQDAWLRGHGITRAQYEAIVENVPRALDGRPRTRESLADRLAELAGSDVREHVLSGWGTLLKPSARRGDLCFGPNRGRNVTFVRPERWLRRSLAAEPAEAGAEIVRRYLSAYGPATDDDFARWIGLRGAAPKRLLRASAAELAEVESHGRQAWVLERDLDALTGASPPGSVRLLPAFDPYVVGFRPRELLVEPRHMPRVFRPQAWITPVVLVDGRVTGVWSHERRGGTLHVRVELLGRSNARVRKEVADETERLASFLDAAPELSLAA
jgi:winged helix DNA-binding protein